jgi:hypothetical protein
MSRIHYALLACTALFAFILSFCTLGNTTGALFAQTPAPDLATSSFTPALNAKGVCMDAPLLIAFATAPLTGTGKIQVFDAYNDAMAASIDLGAPTATQSIGGAANYRYFPVIITGNEAALYLPNGALAYGKTFYVKIDQGAFKDGNGNSFSGIDNAKGWRFSTKLSPPATGTAKLTVAADGSGDFCTVQGALDFIPDGNIAPITVFLRKGTYNEIIYLNNKHSITLLGKDRKQSIIAYANNANFNNAPGAYHRGVFMAQNVNDLVIANMTFRNTTPRGGSQAEAIILNGTANARAIIANVDLIAYGSVLCCGGLR